jgi:hypothetical protein
MLSELESDEECRSVDVNGLSVFYRSAGAAGAPVANTQTC